MNAPPSKIFVILPTYNEERALRQLVPDLTKVLRPLGLPFSICVVDDGSIDGTAHWVHSRPREDFLQHIPHEMNCGYGGAIKTGVVWAIHNARPEDAVITMDADNTHSPAYIPALIHKLQEGYGVVTASYTTQGGSARDVPFVRRVMSFGVNLLLKLRYPFPGIGTYTNGFRAYQAGALQQAYRQFGENLIQEMNFAGGTELFVKTIGAGARPGEIPFILDYGKRGTGSKIHIASTILCYVRLLFR